MKRLFVVALVCGVAALPSLGAPSLGFWDEGAPGTTHLVWDFEPATVLEIFPNASYDADTSVSAAYPAGSVVTPIGVAIIKGTDLDYSNGVFSSLNPITVNLKINNMPNLNAYKEVWVDITGSGSVVPTGVIAEGPGVPAVSFTYTELPPPGPGTGADLGWRIAPNPYYEEVEFSVVPAVGTMATLDTISVDTICIPAPGALLLAGIGAMAVGWLRTRRGL